MYFEVSAPKNISNSKWPKTEPLTQGKAESLIFFYQELY